MSFLQIMFMPGVTAYQKAIILDELNDEFRRIGLFHAVARGNALAVSMFDSAFQKQVEDVRDGLRFVPKNMLLEKGSDRT